MRKQKKKRLPVGDSTWPKSVSEQNVKRKGGEHSLFRAKHEEQACVCEAE